MSLSIIQIKYPAYLKSSFILLYILLSCPYVNAVPNKDHQEITGPFENTTEVIEACLECHEDIPGEVMKTSHWTWTSDQEVPNKGIIAIGKKNIINNMFISINGNWKYCTGCHIGLGWEDENFNFSDETKVDCLVCHDTTGTYRKTNYDGRLPALLTNKRLDKDHTTVDLEFVARNAGLSSRENCIACHGYSGGENRRAHCDNGIDIQNLTKEIDVHLGTDGENLSCQMCHPAQNHRIAGNAIRASTNARHEVDCTNCHDPKPHKGKIKNKHVLKIACQTCHIPFFAKENYSIMTWDWSQAGGSNKTEVDSSDNKIYTKETGRMSYSKHIVPSYAWYNGTTSLYFLGDKIDPDKTTALRRPNGNINDKNSKIFPFKVRTGKQIYDQKNRYFVTPKLFGANGETDAYWTGFDWKKAVSSGMKHTGLNLSGEYGFAPTEMFWPLNHSVAPAEKALKCRDCHDRKGRLNWKDLGYEDDPMKTRKKMIKEKLSVK